MWCFEPMFPPVTKAAAIGYINYELLIKHSHGDAAVIRSSNPSAHGNVSMIRLMI
jgi:D-ribose pyranose/furanose isomerase RbsD